MSKTKKTSKSEAARASKPKKRRALTRKNADRHLLYQWSVQNPEMEVEFMEKVYRKRRGRVPLFLREDFSGTGLTACKWVESHPERTALCLDLDTSTIEWGREQNVAPLGDAAERIELRVDDVRNITAPRADVACAFNFSYYLFRELSELIAYFRQVRSSLEVGGMFFLDTYGGWESQQVKTEPRKVTVPEGRFTYVWDQAAYNPIDNIARCHIHFRFPGGSRWNKAFTYEWRLYTPAEVRDALLAAGFSNVAVYWDHEEDEDKDDDFRLTRSAENCPAWIAYVVADA